jgi:hypothetical protein
MGKTLDKTVYASLLFFVFALAACSTNKESKPMEASQAVKAPPAKPQPRRPGGSIEHESRFA